MNISCKAGHKELCALALPCKEQEQKGAYMSCLICAGQAESVECTGGWEERRCSKCGCYRMSQALILVMMEEGQILIPSGCGPGWYPGAN